MGADAQGDGTLYYWLPRDEVLARRFEGWQSQVWQPKKGAWAIYPDLDLDGEGNEISEQEALQRAHVSTFGEFAPASSAAPSEEGA